MMWLTPYDYTFYMNLCNKYLHKTVQNELTGMPFPQINL